MFVQQLFEGTAKRVIVIYPGRFQPFHLGHKEVFESLQAQFGSENVYIGTSNKVALPKSPFNFSEKLQLMNAAGIPSHQVIEVTNPYMPDDYIRSIGFDPTQTVMIFAVGEPDLARLEVDATYTEKTPTGRPSKIPPGKQVGDPKPFKSFQGLDQATTADQHQYVLIAKERPKTVSVNGQTYDASHGTQVRDLWNQVRNDPKASAEVMKQLYGKASAEIAHVLNNIQDTNAAPAPAAKPSPKLNKVDETSLASRYADDYAYQQAQMGKQQSSNSIQDIIATRDVKAYQNWKQENPNDPIMLQLKAAEQQGTEAMSGIQPMGAALSVFWKTVFDALSQSNQAIGESMLNEDAVTNFASKAHEEWRQGWVKQNNGQSLPRIKKNSDGTEGDINVPFNKLHPDWQRENLAAGKAAAEAVKQFPNDIEKAAEYIHDEWMKRNPKADYNAAQHVPYDQLSEPEKEKDRVHVRTMQQLMGVQPKMSENLADEFAAMAKSKYPTATIRANGQTIQQPPPRKAAPVQSPEPLSPEKRSELEQQLADLERVFDRDYEYSDDHRVWSKHRDIAARISNIKRILATESQITIGDTVQVTSGPMSNLTGIVESIGEGGKFVTVDIHGQDKISVPIRHVSLHETDDHTKHLHLHHKKNRFKTLKKIATFDESEIDEDLYQYDKQDPYNSEFAPRVGMGRMTLRGWKQSMIRRVKEFAAELERSGEDLDRDALWDHVHKKLQSLNLDPIAQEIELAHQELENIRRRGGVRSRAFKK